MISHPLNILSVKKLHHEKDPYFCDWKKKEIPQKLG